MSINIEKLHLKKDRMIAVIVERESESFINDITLPASDFSSKDAIMAKVVKLGEIDKTKYIDINVNDIVVVPSFSIINLFKSLDKQYIIVNAEDVICVEK